MILKRKRLFAGTVPANKNLFAGTVPANKNLFAGTIPANKNLFAGTCSGNKNLFARTPTVGSLNIFHPPFLHAEGGGGRYMLLGS